MLRDCGVGGLCSLNLRPPTAIALMRRKTGQPKDIINRKECDEGDRDAW